MRNPACTVTESTLISDLFAGTTLTTDSISNHKSVKWFYEKQIFKTILTTDPDLDWFDWQLKWYASSRKWWSRLFHLTQQQSDTHRLRLRFLLFRNESIRLCISNHQDNFLTRSSKNSYDQKDQRFVLPAALTAKPPTAHNVSLCLRHFDQQLVRSTTW